MADSSLPSWWNSVEQSAATVGVSSGVLAKIGGVESRFQNVDTAGKASTATGPFQIISGTWDGLAQRYPHLNLSNRRDPEQQARAAPYYLREIKDHITKRAGREPSDGELYLGWFLGPNDAAKVINADPNTNIRSVVNPASVAANGPVFSKINTVADMISWGSRKMGDKGAFLTGTTKYGDGPQFPQGKVSLDQATPPNPYTDFEKHALAKKQAEEAFSFTAGAVEAFKQESTLRWMFESNGASPPDPKFVVTKDILKERAPDVTAPGQLGYLFNSHSQDNFDFRLAQLRKDQEVEKRLEAMGAKGTALRLLGATLDPGGWLAAGALAPVGGGLKLGRFGMIARGALEGAAGNVLAEVPAAMNKPTWERDSLLYSAAGGLAFGAAFGAFRNPGIAKETQELQGAAKALMSKQEAIYGDSSAGAARVGNAVDPVRGDVSEFLEKQFADLYGDRGAFSKWRFDVTGRLKASENPLVRALGNLMGEETVGQADKTKATFRALTEDQVMLQRRFDTEFTSTYQSAWNDWRTRNDVGWFASRNGAETHFRQEITRAMRNTDATVEFDPAIKQVASMWDRINTEYLKLAKGDHRSFDGTTRTPLRGFQDVEPNGSYVPRLVHWDRFRGLLHELGSDDMTRLLHGAIKGMNPDLDDAIAKKIAKGYVGRLHSVDAGQELSASRMFSGLDVEQMRAHLRETGLLDDEIEKALYRATARDEKASGISRGKPRQLLDENFRMELKGREVAIRELFHDDAMHIFNAYNRQMSGAIAMQRLQIKNPKFRPTDTEHPEFLVDGVHSPGDWDTLMAKVRAVADEAGDKAREGRETDVARLQYLYDGIMGIPSKFDRDHPKLAQNMRRFRDYNFVRVMNQVGFAQVAEVGMIIGALGLKTAISSMPGLRTFIRDARTGKLADADARALEYISTAGTDHIRGVGHLITDDFGSPVTHTSQGKVGLTVDALLQRGTRITSNISGMAAIDTYLKRWASKAVLYKFLDMADGGKINRQRMRVLGLDDAMQDRVLNEIKTKRGQIEGEREGGMIETLNLSKWDPEVRGAFEHAIFRWTRKVIQENDLGQTSLLLGSTPGKILFQFRNFMVGAWTKNTLHNVHMRDFESMAMMIGTMVFGGLAYVAQTHLQAIGRPDREKFLEKRLEPKKLAFASFQRAGFSSLLPGVVDNSMYLAGQDPLFDTRVTGQPSQGIVSFAGMSSIDSAMNAVRGVTGMATGDPYSQRDWRAAVGTLPFQNSFPMLWFANSVAHNFPERDPKPGKR